MILGGPSPALSSTLLVDRLHDGGHAHNHSAGVQKLIDRLNQQYEFDLPAQLNFA
jgi:hypothetical protein